MSYNEPNKIIMLRYRAEQIERQQSVLLSELRTILKEIEEYEEMLNMQREEVTH